MEYFDKPKPHIEIVAGQKSSGDSPQTVWLSHGTPVMAITNQPEIGIFNRDRFTVKGWKDLNITLLSESNKDVEILISDFHKCFRVAYCTTIHSTQCMTIDDNVGLYDINFYTRRMAYTAITRVKKLERIFVKSTDRTTNVIFRADELSFQTIPIYENDNAGALYGIPSPSNPDVFCHY
jgi:ATP-dependent exoDNAse (exonuclease V) alpha subunit